MAKPRLLSINVGGPRSFDYQGREATSAIWKIPVEGRVRAWGVNIEGDDQADRSVHGGPDKAVYAYAQEDVEWWESRLGRELGFGAFGENLNTRGVDITNAIVGERWTVGRAVFEVSEPRAPCWKLGYKMGDPTFIRRFSEAGRPGTYLRIVEEGELAAGDEIRISQRPDHGLSVGEIIRIYTRERDKVGRLLRAPQLGGSWREWAEAQLAKRRQ